MGGVRCVLGILGIPSVSREPGILGVLSFGDYRILRVLGVMK